MKNVFKKWYARSSFTPTSVGTPVVTIKDEEPPKSNITTPPQNWKTPKTSDETDIMTPIVVLISTIILLGICFSKKIKS